MKNVWKSIDSMCGYAEVFETASPAERVQVALHTMRAVGRVHWDLLRTAAEVLVYGRLLGGGVIGLKPQVIEGMAWHRIPNWPALRRVAAGQHLVTPTLFRATLWHHAGEGDDGMFVLVRDSRVVGAMVYRPNDDLGERVLQVLPYS